MDDQCDYSVGELAQIVAAASAEADVDLIVRRLRSWTLSGALLAQGDPFAGSGRHRRYDQTGLYCAAVLNALAVNDQPISVLHEVGRFIRNLSGPEPLIVGQTLKRWRQAITQDADIYLVRAALLRVRGLGDAGGSVIDGLMLPDELLPMMRSVNGGVFINLTRVLAGLPR